MQYYEAFVSSQRYHGASALTYSYTETLQAGTIVLVPLQQQSVLGVIVRSVAIPPFATKPISKVIVRRAIPGPLLSLHAWLHAYYPAPLGTITQLFMPASLAQQARAKTNESTVAPTGIQLPPLTIEQQDIIAAVQAAPRRPTLLHGDTGTGKTRVYLELAAQAFAKEQSVLIMTPEIGLTPQLAHTVERSFPGQVITIHSTLTNAERRQAWLRIAQANAPIIVVGPRSALFSPIHKLGLIVMDEAHDSAYKQEQMPYYQASRVAAKLAALHHARLIFGTATPLISDYYALSEKQLPILRMRTAAVQHAKVNEVVHVVNLRDRNAFSRSSWISDVLIKAILEAMNNSQQALIFLNRRGSARLILCQICGWQAVCPRCDLPLTYHGDSHSVHCHTCGYHKTAPHACEDCGATDIVFRSIGTKSLVTELEKLFPKARIGRYDSDNTKAEGLDQQYHAIKAGKVDIIVGTQLLTKGLDLPALSVVGVVIADTALYFPDYTAEERMYQMLTQVAGRVGRGHQAASTVIVQTYHPESLTIKAALSKDYQTFYNQQLAERKTYHFPPFYYTLKLSVNRANTKVAEKAALKLVDHLRTHNLSIELIGPSPAFAERINNRYYWQIVVKSKNRPELLKVISLLPANWSYDLDPNNLL